MKKLFLLALAAAFSWPAFSYIPSSDTILDRTVKNQRPNNRGYQVTLEVRLENEAEKLVFEEVWTIRNDQSMRLRLKGKSVLSENFAREYIYDGNRRYRINQTGDLVSADLGNEHFERYFHFRDKDRFKDFLMTGEFIYKIEEPESSETYNPDSAVSFSAQTVRGDTGAKNQTENTGTGIDPSRLEEPLTNSKIFHYVPEPFTHLSRVSGIVAYALGIPTPNKNPQLNPRLWIEQDRFHIRKIRTKEQTTLVADDYKRSWGLDFPKLRKLNWKSHEVEISLLEIKKIIVGPKTRKALQPVSLKTSKFETKNDLAETLGGSTMSEFYQRFR